MQIQNAQLKLTAQHHFQRSEQQVNVEIENGRLVEDEGRNDTGSRAASLVEQNQQFYRVALPTSEPSTEQQSPPSLDIETSLLKALVEAMTGRKIEDTEFTPSSETPGQSNSQLAAISIEEAPAPAAQRLNVSLNLVSEYEYSEVSIGGTLTTDNGQQLEISQSVTMERSYQETALGILRREGLVTDPLVINFNGDTARLSPGVTEFDLDSDGNADALPTLVSNSACLALDKNGDGIINNGSELGKGNINALLRVHTLADSFDRAC